jgi:hypothetical protein
MLPCMIYRFLKIQGPIFETRAVGSAGVWLNRSCNRALHRAVPYTDWNEMKSGVRQIGPLCRGSGVDPEDPV